jgi:hypothetical protein
MEEELERQAYELYKQRRITTPFLMRKLKISWDMAQRICNKIWIRSYREAKALANGLEFDGWPAQLDSCRKKNLEKFKKVKK